MLITGMGQDKNRIRIGSTHALPPHRLRRGFLSTCLLISLPLATFPPLLHGQLHLLETENLRLIYFTKGHEYIVPHIARCFENALQFHSRLFDYTRSEKITVIVQDFGDFGNGGATGVPRNLISIGISPFQYTYETMPAVERMSWMMNHELAHIVTMDKASPSSKFFRSFFGGKIAPTPEAPLSMLYSYLTSPRLFAPSWFFEGQAVFMETWMNGGLGRALGAYDEMMFRTMVRDSAYFYDVVGLESEGTKVDFQVGANSYLYGTRFLSYLALHHGPEKVVSWNNHTDDSKNYFATRFHQVFGAPLDEEWSRWTEWEHEWQRANLDSIRRYPLTQWRTISQGTLGSVSRPFYDVNRRAIYAGINYPGQVPHLASITIDDGKIQKLKDIRGGALFYVTSLAFDSSAQTVFFSTDNNQWRDLHAYDIRTGTSRLLMKDGRTGDFTLNRKDRSLWGVRHYNGLSSLVRIPHPYQEWNLVHAWPYGQDIFDIDISPDGSRIIATLAESDGTQKLIVMDTERLLGGEFSYELIFDFDISTPANFVFSADGNHLFGSSFFSGVSNIVRYDFETRDMNYLTNCETGLFRPLPVSPDSLVAFLYTGKGFVPVMIPNRIVDSVGAIRYLGNEVVKRHPVLRTWHLRPSLLSRINIDSLTLSRGEYHGLGAIGLMSWYPVVEGYKDFAAYGIRLNLADPLFSHSVDLTASYTPNRILPEKERLHAVVNYKFWSWRIGGTYNGADFYDLFGPTKTSRKGYSLSVLFKDYAIFDEPETMDYQFFLGAYGGLERLPDYQNVSTSFDRFLSFNARVNYQNLARSLGAVEEEKGFVWQAVFHSNYVNAKVFPRFHTNLAFGFQLPLNHSSVWLRGFGGHSLGRREEPFANFFFGGFGNNWVDRGAVHRFREDHSFPGVEINRFGGTNFLKGMLEWDLPPVRFRKFGIATLYCNWTRLALFASGIVTNLDSVPLKQSAINVGGQLDFRLVMFSSFESTFSLGYAFAAEHNQRLSREFMISLKILK